MDQLWFAIALTGLIMSSAMLVHHFLFPAIYAWILSDDPFPEQDEPF